MPICGNITDNILNSCAYPLVAGSNDRLVLINHDDYLKSALTIDNNNPLLVTDIILPSGSYAYTVQGQNGSNESQYELVKTRYSVNFDHVVNFKVFMNDPGTKKVMNDLPKGRFVAIVQNNHKGENGNAAFEIYGSEIGLEITEFTRNNADNETQGAPALVLRTPAEGSGKEPYLPMTLWNTNYATTKAIVDSLIKP